MPKPLVLMADGDGVGASAPAPDPVHPWKHHGSVHSRVMDYDPLFNRTTTYWYDETDRQAWLTETWHDLSPIVEHAKGLRAMTDERSRLTPLRDGGEVSWTHTAHVPMAIVPEVLRMTSNGKDREAVSRWHKDPANDVFIVRHIRKGV